MVPNRDTDILRQSYRALLGLCVRLLPAPRGPRPAVDPVQAMARR